MVASISTCRRAALITRSTNSWMRSCWRWVARTVMTPLSALMMTEAASRKVLRRTTELPTAWLVEFGLGLVCSALAMACAARWPVPCGKAAAPEAFWALLCSTTVSLEPSGRILSVSRNRSLMVFFRDPQNGLRAVLSIRVLEMLPALALLLAVLWGPLLLGVPVAIWVLAETVPVTLRAMFT